MLSATQQTNVQWWSAGFVLFARARTYVCVCVRLDWADVDDDGVNEMVVMGC